MEPRPSPSSLAEEKTHSGIEEMGLELKEA